MHIDWPAATVILGFLALLTTVVIAHVVAHIRTSTRLAVVESKQNSLEEWLGKIETKLDTVIGGGK